MPSIFYARCHSRVLARAPQNTKHVFVYIQHTLQQTLFLQSVTWAVFNIPGVSLGE